MLSYALDIFLTLFSFYFRVIFNTLFGLSVNYWMAIASRFLLGAMNGILGPIKVFTFSLLTDVVDPSLY